MANVTHDAAAFVANAYDVLIIGGGTAGLALASRLSEEPHLRIGVIEAGPDKSTDPLLTSGGGWLQTSRDARYHWGFSSSPQENLTEGGKKGRIVNLPHGKVLGGSSAINAMNMIRASKAEYDALETTFGNPGWNFASLLPYFIKTQSHTAQPSEIFPDASVLPVHGTQGPIKTSQNWWYSSLIAPYVDTVRASSFEVNNNPDGGNPLGLFNPVRSLDPQTVKRQDAVATYLKLTEGRNNISVLVGACACKILFTESDGEDLSASGVEFQFGELKYIVDATREVILSAGAYNTPQLLELSGIGQKAILEKYSIQSKIELLVGENLQDHMVVYSGYKLKDEKILKEVQPGQKSAALPSGFTVKCVGTDNQEQDPNRSAKLSVTGSPFLMTHLRSLSENKQYDQEFDELLTKLDKLASDNTISPLERAQHRLQRHWLANPQENVGEGMFLFTCLPGFAGTPEADGGMTFWAPIIHMHPASRGSVHISSADPLEAPTIDLRCLNDYDLQAMKRIVRFGDGFTKKEPLASLLVEQPSRTDAEHEELIKQSTEVLFHPVGTAPMASRELGGVVDHNLKVYGTKNLRIVDASVFPLQIGTMPQATIYAFAEKAADIIKAALKA